MTSLLQIVLFAVQILRWIVLVHVIMSWLINFQVLNLRQPLRTGTYEARWQSAGADGHKMAGKITFNVK